MGARVENERLRRIQAQASGQGASRRLAGVRLNRDGVLGHVERRTQEVARARQTHRGQPSVGGIVTPDVRPPLEQVVAAATGEAGPQRHHGVRLVDPHRHWRGRLGLGRQQDGRADYGNRSRGDGGEVDLPRPQLARAPMGRQVPCVQPDAVRIGDLHPRHREVAPGIALHPLYAQPAQVSDALAAREPRDHLVAGVGGGAVADKAAQQPQDHCESEDTDRPRPWLWARRGGGRDVGQNACPMLM